MFKLCKAFTVLFLVFCWATHVYGANYLADLHQLIDSGKIKVILALKNHQPFFSEGKDGAIHGITIDLINDIARDLGVTPELIIGNGSYNKGIADLAAGRADIMIGDVSKTLDRGKKVLFSNSYTIMHEAFLVRSLWLAQSRKKFSGVNNPVELFQLSNARIGVMRASSYSSKAFSLYKSSNVIEYSSLTDLIAALQSHKIDVIFYNDLGEKMFLLEHPSYKLFYKIIVMTKVQDPIAIAVVKSHGGLLQWLNLYLELKDIHWNSDSIIKASLS